MRRSGLIALAVIAAGCGGPEVTGSDKDKQMLDAVQKAGGDLSKLDPETRKKVEDNLMNNPMSTANRPGGPGPGASGKPSGYPTPGGQ